VEEPFLSPIEGTWGYDVGQTEIHTAEPLVPELSAFEVELAIEKLKSNKSPGVDQTPVQVIKAGGGTIRYEIHKPLISIWNKEWKVSIIVPIYKKGDKTDCNTHSLISLFPTTTKFYPTSCCQG